MKTIKYIEVKRSAFLKDKKVLLDGKNILTNRTTVEDIVSRQDFPILFIGTDEKLDENGLNTMLDYFISTEEYEKCQELVELYK